MKHKLYKTILPPTIGIFVVLLVLFIVDLFLYGTVIIDSLLDKSSILFYEIILLPAIVISIVSQLFLTLPLWDRFKQKKKVIGLTLLQFTTLLIIVSGTLFGLTFWERVFGLYEFLLTSIVGIIAFAIYWTINLFTIIIIEKKKK